jgi:hypothetical protein
VFVLVFASMIAWALSVDRLLEEPWLSDEQRHEFREPRLKRLLERPDKRKLPLPVMACPPVVSAGCLTRSVTDFADRPPSSFRRRAAPRREVVSAPGEFG